MDDRKKYLKPFTSENQPKNNGRPKGSKNRSTIARKWLEVNTTDSNPLTGQDETLSQEDLMTLALIKKAREGDTNAYKALMDSGYGAPQVDITTDGQPMVNNLSVEIIKPLNYDDED